jgi:hypothetical protein
MHKDNYNMPVSHGLHSGAMELVHQLTNTRSISNDYLSVLQTQLFVEVLI